MWLMTTGGFVSVVQHQGDPKMLHVRARVKGDLEEIRAKWMPGMNEPYSFERSDYAWRADVSREEFIAGVAKMVGEIDYFNFKKKVAEVQGNERAEVYGRVWSVLYELQEFMSSRTE
jgi:hypothetical protein